LLRAYRFIADGRDHDTAQRLDNLEDPYRLFPCHTIMNCVDVCPKGLNPARAIGKIKELMVRRATGACTLEVRIAPDRGAQRQSPRRDGNRSGSPVAHSKGPE